MKIIIVGAGSVGLRLAQMLAASEHDVVLIEKDKARLDHVSSSLNIQTLLGDGCVPATLINAGISTADYFIAVTNQDAFNVMACVTAKLLNADTRRVARLRHTNYQNSHVSEESRDDLFELIVNPAVAAADYLHKVFQVPGANEIVEFADGKLRVIALTITAKSPVINRKLKSLDEYRENHPILIIAIDRAGKLIIPRATDKIRVGDIIYLVAPQEKTALLFELAGRPFHEGKSAIIWGGSAIGTQLAKSLEASGTHVKLIVNDTERAEELAAQFDQTLVLHGSGTDQELLLSENINEIDAFISVTHNEEENILAALLAKQLGVGTGMALVNRETYLNIVPSIGVDVVVSSLTAAASKIFKHIQGDALVSDFSLRHQGATFLDIIATQELSWIGTQFKDLKLPDGILICGIVRADQVIVPRGVDQIEVGDRVIIFISKPALKKVEKTLSLIQAQ